MKPTWFAWPLLSCMAYPVFASVPASTLPPIAVTCDNYQTANLNQPSEQSYTVADVEIDCSEVSAQRPQYRAQRTPIFEATYQNVVATIDKLGNTRQPVTYLDEIPHLEQVLTTFIKRSPWRGYPRRFLLRHALPPKLPNHDAAATLVALEGEACWPDKNKIVYAGITHFRDWSYLEQPKLGQKMWLIHDCENKPAQLYIQHGDDTAHHQIYTLPTIEHEFAYTEQVNYVDKVRDGFKDISTDGRTVLMEQIDRVNYAFVHLDMVVLSQLTVNILRHDQIYSLPQQRLISIDDHAFARLSADGDRVVIASNHTLKLYEYQPEHDQYYWVGQYVYTAQDTMNPYSLMLTNNGLTALISTHDSFCDCTWPTYQQIQFEPMLTD